MTYNLNSFAQNGKIVVSEPRPIRFCWSRCGSKSSARIIDGVGSETFKCVPDRVERREVRGGVQVVNERQVGTAQSLVLS